MDWIKLEHQQPNIGDKIWVPSRNSRDTGNAVVGIVYRSGGQYRVKISDNESLPFKKWATYETQY